MRSSAVVERVLDGRVGSLARRGIARLGLKIQRCPPRATGIDAFQDMKGLIGAEARPLVIDVGAHVGQTVHRFKEVLPSSEIHSFEPSPATYRELTHRVARYSDVHTIPSGLGAEVGEAMLLENDHSDMSSFLRPGRLAWGRITQETRARVDTLDAYSAAHDLRPIEVLKTDTQGFDLEVLKGARRLMQAGRVHMIYMEIIFSEQYEGVPSYDETFLFMKEHGFKMVSLYGFCYQEGLASWCNALFVYPEFNRS